MHFVLCVHMDNAVRKFEEYQLKHMCKLHLNLRLLVMMMMMMMIIIIIIIIIIIP